MTNLTDKEQTDIANQVIQESLVHTAEPGTYVDGEHKQADLEVTSKKAEEFTPKKLRELMRLYFTVRHPKVRGCGHKLDLSRDPRHGCESCWFSYFKEQGTLVQTADECFVKEGRQMLERLRGRRFVSYFVKFMSTLAHFRAAQLAEQEKNDSNRGSEAGETGAAGGFDIGGPPNIGSKVEDIEGSGRGAEQTA